MRVGIKSCGKTSIIIEFSEDLLDFILGLITHCYQVRIALGYFRRGIWEL